MTALIAERTAAEGTVAARASLGHRLGRWLSDNVARIYAVVGFVYLFVPIAYVFVFSFNDGGKRNLVWNGFTWQNWSNPCRVPEVCSAVVTSVQIGLLATAVATVLGTLIAVALVRYRFRGRTATNLLIFLPMATPEVVLGSSLLTMFLNMRVNPGFGPVLIAHVMFTISFVVVTVKARLTALDPRLEQAAMDLYASEWQTFRRITLPLIAPGIAGAALLAFALSFDDFIITNFNSGTVNTFPKVVYTSAQRGIPAQAYVIGSAMFFIALAIVLLGTILGQRRGRAPVGDTWRP